MGLGRILIWLNVFVVPTLVIYSIGGIWVGVIVAVVNGINAWYLDMKVRPKLERLSRMLDKFLKSWE